MTRKISVFTAVFLILITFGAFSFGIGIQGGYNLDLPGNTAVTFKLESVPLVFATNFGFDKEHFAIGLTLDYWLLDQKIIGPLAIFLGVGAGALFTMGNDFWVDATGRIPVGFHILFANWVDPYIQAVPALALRFHPDFGTRFALDTAIGVRFWVGRDRGKKAS